MSNVQSAQSQRNKFNQSKNRFFFLINNSSTTDSMEERNNREFIKRLANDYIHFKIFGANTPNTINNEEELHQGHLLSPRSPRSPRSPLRMRRFQSTSTGAYSDRSSLSDSNNNALNNSTNGQTVFEDHPVMAEVGRMMEEEEEEDDEVILRDEETLTNTMPDSMRLNHRQRQQTSVGSYNEVNTARDFEDQQTGDDDSFLPEEKQFRKTSRVLRKVSVELERSHSAFFDNVCDDLTLSRNDPRATFKNVSERVLNRDSLNWGRVVSLFTFGGKLAEWFWNTQQEDKIEEVEEWLAESLSTKEEWIEENGGWVRLIL